MTLVGHRLLPENRDLAENLGAIGKEYLTEMRLLTGSPLIGKTVESAGLRNLQSLFLVEIRRNDEMLVPVRPTEILRADDHLVFTGKADAIVQFQKSRGLAPCEEKSHFDQLVEGGKGRIIEAVVSHSSPMLGKSVKEGNFRARYDAAVLAVHRHGEKLETKIGETVLRAGDTILLLGGDDFVKQWNFSRDFYMISKLFDAPVINRKRSVVSLATLCAIIGLAAFGVTDVLTAAVCGTAVLLLTRTITAVEARKAIEVNVLVVIAASLGLGQALEKTGAAAYLASQIVGAVQGAGPVAILAAVYLAAGILTEVITNNAAAALVFPIAMAAAAQAGLNPRPFAIALVIAASASFSTPIGYQTNLMVCGPGGYRFRDFVRVGLPLNCLFFAVSIVVIPLVWSF
jgi:di/tricarboxylate transporter